ELAIGTEGNLINGALMRQGRFDWRGRVQPPQADGAGSAPGQDRLAIGAESDGSDDVAVGQAGAQAFPGGGVPQLGRAVKTAGDNGLAVGAESQCANAIAVLQRGADG